MEEAGDAGGLGDAAYWLLHIQAACSLWLLYLPVSLLGPLGSPSLSLTACPPSLPLLLAQQPWPEPDDRLSDVTIRHNALWGAAGSLSVSAGALTVVYSGAGPADLLTLLTGGGSGGPSALRTLRLSARSLRFAAVSAKAGGSQGAGGQQGGQGAAAAAAAEAAGEQQQEEAPPAANEHNSCSGTELRDFISGSEWAAVWEVKLQRSLIRGQEVLVLARRQPPPVAASPAVAPALAAAAAPATL